MGLTADNRNLLNVIFQKYSYNITRFNVIQRFAATHNIFNLRQ